jgi:hypothetical protein
MRDPRARTRAVRTPSWTGSDPGITGDCLGFASESAQEHRVGPVCGDPRADPPAAEVVVGDRPGAGRRQQPRRVLPSRRSRPPGDRHRTRPAAGGVPGLPTQPRERRDHGRETAFGDTIATIQSQVQTFYTFLFDHSADAALATGDRRFTEITETHTRLWSPIHRVRIPRNQRELTWHSTADLQRMLAYLDVLGADPAERVTVTHVDGRLSVVAGLVDPQAARAWLLQALTGRRASEIEMRSFRRLLRRP